jgi:hypothetical protein
MNKSLITPGWTAFLPLPISYNIASMAKFSLTLAAFLVFAARVTVAQGSDAVAALSALRATRWIALMARRRTVTVGPPPSLV